MAGHCYEVKFDQFLQFLPLYGVFCDFDQQSILKENVVNAFCSGSESVCKLGRENDVFCTRRLNTDRWDSTCRGGLLGDGSPVEVQC